MYGRETAIVMPESVLFRSRMYIFQILFVNILSVLSVSFQTNFACEHCISYFVFVVKTSLSLYELFMERLVCKHAYSSEVCPHDQIY